MGKIGKDRTFLVTPDDKPDFHLLTDLSGFTTATYQHELWLKEEKKALEKAANKIKEQVKKLGKRELFLKDIGIIEIENFYKMSGLTYAYMNRREALDKMFEDIGSAQKSVEMYARVYLSELIKETKSFVNAIEKAIQAPGKNELRIRVSSPN